MRVWPVDPRALPVSALATDEAYALLCDGRFEHRQLTRVSVDARATRSGAISAERKREKELHRPEARLHEGAYHNRKRRAHEEVNEGRK